MARDEFIYSWASGNLNLESECETGRGAWVAPVRWKPSTGPGWRVSPFGPRYVRGVRNAGPDFWKTYLWFSTTSSLFIVTVEPHIHREMGASIQQIQGYSILSEANDVVNLFHFLSSCNLWGQNYSRPISISLITSVLFPFSSLACNNSPWFPEASSSGVSVLASLAVLPWVLASRALCLVPPCVQSHLHFQLHWVFFLSIWGP